MATASRQGDFRVQRTSLTFILGKMFTAWTCASCPAMLLRSQPIHECMPSTWTTAQQQTHLKLENHITQLLYIQKCTS